MTTQAQNDAFNANQVNIPTDLPDILKAFTKAVIRTQPEDLLQFSAEYFTALSKNEPPPGKERLHLVNGKQADMDAIGAVHRKFGGQDEVSRKELKEKWEDMGLDGNQLDTAISMTKAEGDNIPYTTMLVSMCALLSQNFKTILGSTCHLLTPEPDDGLNRVQLETFQTVYRQMLMLENGGKEAGIDKLYAPVMDYLKEESTKHDGRIGPNEFNSSRCPKMNKNDS